MTFAHSMPFGAQLRDDGVRFRLWAPARDEVALNVDGTRHAMTPSRDGWFEAFVAGARAGSRYAFELPDMPVAVPDPASRFQPDGPHAPSAVVDPNAYDWRTSDWRGRPWHETVLYELHVGTFTPEGTYAAAAAHLDDLVELGVTAIELMPLAQPAGDRNWGYDGVLPFAPQRAYGTPDELKALMDAAHERGLSVLLDVVYNHFGPEGNYLHAYAPQFFTDRHHTPWGQALNVGGPESATVREFFIHNALYWLDEYRFDGLRFDAVHEIHDDSEPSLLVELAQRVRARVEPGRHVDLVLENDANQAGLLRYFDAQWNDDVHHAFHVLLTGEREGYYRDFAQDPARLLARALAEGFAYQGEPSGHRGGRRRGEPSAALPSTRFVDFLQNHDQVGNRALGERIAALAQPEALAAASTILLLAPSIPMLFMGEEWSASTPFSFFSAFGPELAAAVTEGRRREFAAWPAFSDPEKRARIPDPQDEATQRASILRWEERKEPAHARVLDAHRRLLALRREQIVPRLRDGASGISHAADGTALRVRWRLGDGSHLTLIANLGTVPATLPSDAGGAPLYVHGTVDVGDDAIRFGPWSAGWYLTPDGSGTR